MKLEEGQRLSGPGRSAYVVRCLEADTPWYRLYRAQKVFYNFRYDDRQIYEAAEDEWIDVLVRVSAYAEDVLPADVEKRQQLLRYEATEVLTGGVPWFAQAVEWIEVQHARAAEVVGQAAPCLTADSSASGTECLTYAGRREPALVLSRFEGRSLRRWRNELPAPSPECLRLGAETAELLMMLHARRQCVGGWGPDDFLIDSRGRLFFLATDRIVPAEGAAWLRRFYPPERYPAGYVAPEIAEPDGAIDVGTDRYTWAALSFFLVTGREPAEFVAHETAPAGLSDEGRVVLETALARFVPGSSECPEPPWSPPAGTGDRTATLADRWAACIERCLGRDRAARRAAIDAPPEPEVWRPSFWQRVRRRG
jgi:hypothetical protein